MSQGLGPRQCSFTGKCKQGSKGQGLGQWVGGGGGSWGGRSEDDLVWGQACSAEGLLRTVLCRLSLWLPKVQGFRGREALSRTLAKRHFVLIDQLVIHEGKNGYLEGVHLAVS